MPQLYYTPPSDEQFEELKKMAIEVWKNYDDQYGYATGKINVIKDLANIQDNFMYMVAMFDNLNQGVLADKLTPETRLAVRERMPEEYILF
jgi:hypothetical protein